MTSRALTLTQAPALIGIVKVAYGNRQHQPRHNGAEHESFGHARTPASKLIVTSTFVRWFKEAKEPVQSPDTTSGVGILGSPSHPSLLCARQAISAIAASAAAAPSRSPRPLDEAES